MAEYSVGVATRNKIYEVSKHLFYERGIKDTSYADICKVAEVNRGLIPYYFKSKSKLAIMVLNEFVDSMGAAVESRWGDQSLDPLTENALIELLQFELLEEDGHVLRFYGEAMASSDFHDQLLAVQARVITQLSQGAPIELSDAALRTFACMMHGTENELVQAMRTHYLTEGVESFVRRDIEWIYRMLGFSDKTIDEACERGFSLARDYRFTCDDRFCCEVVPARQA